MSIVDVHAHIERTHLAPYNRSGEENLNLLTHEMRSAGIAHAILITSPDGMPGNRCFCGVQVVGTHETIRLAGNSKKFSVVAGIDALRRVSAQVKELDRLFRERKIVGLKVYLGYQAIFANDRRLTPFYKLCLRHDVPVVFHTGDTNGSKFRVKYSHPLPIDDVAVDFPKLKIVIAHLGNPWLWDCAELLYKNENVYADISGLVADQNPLTLKYGRMMRARIRDLCVYASPRKLLFGTDWPLARLADYVEFTKSFGIPARDLEYLFHKNAEELFRTAKR